MRSLLRCLLCVDTPMVHRLTFFVLEWFIGLCYVAQQTEKYPSEIDQVQGLNLTWVKKQQTCKTELWKTFSKPGELSLAATLKSFKNVWLLASKIQRNEELLIVFARYSAIVSYFLWSGALLKSYFNILLMSICWPTLKSVVLSFIIVPNLSFFTNCSWDLLILHLFKSSFNGRFIFTFPGC